ncbi:hypothetical protein K9B33_11515 [Sphingobium sp. 3R8]|uniref:esterase/lipase family protein n=1 Tax=Sphingobium sp. 3R8 TaxID=2874921 RepID=UPI001CCBC3AA|nr:hypothetical protein [Sphingobium sp. 3R8]MBZ9648178.1 hypothetical protein [Sphingobium sp. 3R8]
MRILIDRQEQQCALVMRTDQTNKKLAVFVHGFGGTHLTTWGDLASCLEQIADDEAPFGDWDYLFFGYDTPSAPSLMSITRRLETWIQDAAEGDGIFPHAYERFALFGHSLGTLAIRQLLCSTIGHPIRFNESLQAVVLFASPVDGSWLAKWASWSGFLDMISKPHLLLSGANKVAAALEPGGPLIDMLRTWYATIRSYVNYPQVLIVQGSDDAVLGYGTGEKWEDDRRKEVSGGHIAMTKVKTTDWHQSVMRDRIKAALL